MLTIFRHSVFLHLKAKRQAFGLVPLRGGSRRGRLRLSRPTTVQIRSRRKLGTLSYRDAACRFIVRAFQFTRGGSRERGVVVIAMSLDKTEARPPFDNPASFRLTGTRIERVAQFLGNHARKPLCDSCIAACIELFSVTDASYAGNALRRRIGKFQRHRGTCARCERRRFVTAAL